MGKTVNPVWVSGHYKLIDRSNDTSVANWVFKAEDTAWTQASEAFNVGVVFGWGESAGQTTSTASGVITLQYNVNGGGWNTVTSTSAVKYANSAAVTDAGTYGTAYTSAPTGVASWGGTGEYDENNSATSRTPVDQYFEALFVLTLDSAQLANGDSITFQILHGGAAFDTTDATPTLTYYETPPTNYTVTADSGTYTYTGQSATILKTNVLSASHGTYTYTGQSATLSRSYDVAAGYGSYTYTGQNATIDYATGPSGYEIVANHGTYTYTGQDATLSRSYDVAADYGSYIITGQDTTLVRDYVLTAEAGTYSLVGINATITYTGATVVTDIDTRANAGGGKAKKNLPYYEGYEDSRLVIDDTPRPEPKVEKKPEPVVVKEVEKPIILLNESIKSIDISQKRIKIAGKENSVVKAKDVKNVSDDDEAIILLIS